MATLFPELLAMGASQGGGEVIEEWAPLSVNLGRLLAVLFFVLLNGFFVAAEFAIVKVRSSQLDHLVAEGSSAAVRARKITSKLDAYLSATQLGITLASIALGVLAEPFAAALLEPLMVKMGMTSPALIHSISFGMAFVFVTFLHVVLGELMPKSLAIRRALPTTLIIARPLMVFHYMFLPAIWVFNGTANKLLKWTFRIDPVSESEIFHSAEELKILLDETQRSLEVTPIEREILMNAMGLNELLARDIMTPRSEVVWLDVNDDFKTNFDKAIESQHTRFPLVSGHLDDTTGLIHAKDLMRLSAEEKRDLKSIRRTIEPVPEMMPVDKLLQSFLSHRAHMALVVDEYGGALGIVTLEDVLEELVGEIQDEFDEDEEEEEGFVRVSEEEFIVDGTLPLYELDEYADLELEDPEVSTVGGYITHQFGHLPESGEQVHVEGHVVTVVESDGRSIGKLNFRRLEEVPLEEVEEHLEPVETEEEKENASAS